MLTVPLEALLIIYIYRCAALSSASGGKELALDKYTPHIGIFPNR